MKVPREPRFELRSHALIKQAKKVERLQARRRRIVKSLREVDQDIRQAKRFLAGLAADLAMPTDQPMTRGEKGDLL
jgi:hypothetical protein